jgi:iron-sulfur cluster assembly protein CyaY
MNDSQYNVIADELLLAIEEAVEACAENNNEEIDYEGISGLLTLTFKNQSKIIINKQAPLHEIWVATKFNGHHFIYQDNHWQDKRSGDELWQFLSVAISKQAASEIILSAS